MKGLTVVDFCEYCSDANHLKIFAIEYLNCYEELYSGIPNY